MDGTVHHALDDAFQWEEWQTKMLDGFVIASCSLSIMGSLFIFLSYTLWSDLRTTPRFMLVCLSLADLITASGQFARSLPPLHFHSLSHTSFL
jgi:hypothetical protein